MKTRSITACFLSLCLLAAVSSLALAAQPVKNVSPINLTRATSPASGPKVSLRDGSYAFDLSMLPMDGSINAPNEIVAITDPGCVHSRNTQRALSEAIETFAPGKLAVVYLPGTGNVIRDGPVQTLLLSIWRENPALWHALNRGITSGAIAPNVASIREAAVASISKSSLLDEWVAAHAAWANEQISLTSHLMVANSPLAHPGSWEDADLPQIQAGKHLVVGTIPTASDAQRFITEEYGLIPDKVLRFQREMDSSLASRECCGSLAIVYIGAGENLGYKNYKNSVDPAIKDLLSVLPTLTKANQKSSKVVLFSSDSTSLMAKARSAAKKASSDNFRDFPTSRTAFDQLFNSPERLNALKNEYAEIPECRRLMRLHPDSDVSEFIRVSFYAFSHSAGRDGDFLPIWPTDAGHGTDVQHQGLWQSSSERYSGYYLSANDFVLLRSVFKWSVFFGTFVTCNSVRIAEAVFPSASEEYASYMAFTGANTIAVRSHDGPSVFDCVPPSRKGLCFFELRTPMLQFYRWSLFGSGPGGLGGFRDSIFTIEPTKRNPFDFFVISSAEVFAEKIIETYGADEGKFKNSAVESNTNFQADYAEVLALIERRKQLQQSWLDTLKRDPATLKESRESAKECINQWVVRGPKQTSEQEKFSSLLALLFDKYQKNDLSKDSAAIGALQWLEQVKKDVGGVKDSPLLLGINERPLESLDNFREMRNHFADFRFYFKKVNFELGLGNASDSALENMSVAMATFHASYINAYFPDIVQDTLSRRLQTLRRAADLVRDKHAATGDASAERDLKNLRKHLSLSLDIPFTPFK